MPLNLNNIMLGSEDSTRLADFYSKVLGAANSGWSDGENGWFGFRVGDGSLAIGPHSEVKSRNAQPGRIMLNFATADVRGELERISLRPVGALRPALAGRGPTGVRRRRAGARASPAPRCGRPA